MLCFGHLLVWVFSTYFPKLSAITGTQAGYTVHKMPVHHRANAETETTIHAHTKTYGQFRITGLPAMHAFWTLGEEAGVPGDHVENMQNLTERRFGPGIFLMWGDYANHCTTMASSSFLLHMKYLDIEKTAWAGSPLSPPLPTPLHSTAFYSADDLMVYLNQLDD